MIQNTVIYFGMFFFSIRKHNLGTYIINRVNEIVLIKYLYFHISIILTVQCVEHLVVIELRYKRCNEAGEGC